MIHIGSFDYSVQCFAYFTFLSSLPYHREVSNAIELLLVSWGHARKNSVQLTILCIYVNDRMQFDSHKTERLACYKNSSNLGGAVVVYFYALTAGRFDHLLAQKNGTDLNEVFLGSAHQ